MERYLAGVSVRRVEDITEALWGTRVSSSTVSRLNQRIYKHIEAWRNRAIDGDFPYQSGRSVAGQPALGAGETPPFKIVGVFKETASGAKNDRAERKKILDLVQARKIEVVLVTELTRWGRSMIDLFQTLQDLQAAGVSLVAQTGLQFDLRTAQGKLIASLMSALSEFEHDLLRERVRSGIAAAQKRGVVFGRRPGQRIKADRHAPRVLKLVEAGQSYREISYRLGISKNTVLDIVKRDRAA